jgi:pre-mRNA-processing factor SLU7
MDKLQKDSDKTEQELQDEQQAIRSLRERTDTAHYLKDLSKDSNAYDPETGTYKGVKGTLNDKGEFVRELDDDSLQFERMRKQAEAVSDLAAPMEAGPTAGYLRAKKLQEEEKARQQRVKNELLGKYGGAEYLAARPREIEERPVVAVAGKPADPPPAGKSKYQEDIYPGNHTSVWGSYWKDGQWGFSCCHSVVKQSYCVGDLGRKRPREGHDDGSSEDDNDNTEKPRDG